MLKIGAKVRVCTPEQLTLTQECFGVSPNMIEFCDHVATVTSVRRDGRRRRVNVPGFDHYAYSIDIDDGAWIWSNVQLFPISPCISVF